MIHPDKKAVDWIVIPYGRHRRYRAYTPQVARVPELHLIDAVLSADERRLLAKDGLDSCALR